MRISETAFPEATGCIAVFGGSGATGRSVIDRLLADGWQVRALCRTATSLEKKDGLTVIEGQLHDAKAIDDTVKGTVAALILFGPHPPYSDIFCADATAAIVTAMRKNGMKRLICQTGGMIGDYPKNRTWAMRRLTAAFNHRFPELAADRKNQESIVMESNLEWTILKPPRLTDGPASGIICGTEVRVGMLSSVSRHSIANWIATELRESRPMQQILFIRRNCL